MKKVEGVLTADDIGGPNVIHNKFSSCARESSSNIVSKFEKDDEAVAGKNSGKKKIQIRSKLVHFCQCSGIDCAKALFEK
jgi:hypothetical protein